jgi:hypothetical protein
MNNGSPIKITAFSVYLKLQCRCLLFSFPLFITQHLIWVTSGFIFSTDRSVMSILNLYVSKPSKCQELWFDWAVYLTVSYMIGWFFIIYFLFLVFNATFNNISAISWRPVLVVEEAGVSGENHRPWASNG